MSSIVIEMVIPQLAEKGGLDKIINTYSAYLREKEDMELSLVQLVDTGLVWWDGNCPVRNLCRTGDNPSYMDAAKVYAAYLEKAERKPDIILATGWPVTITIVREALRQTGLSIPLVGYPHMTLQEGEEKGVGGPSCINDADVVFTISRQIESEIKKCGASVRTIRVNNGICFPKAYSKRENPKNNKLLYIGRLVEGKNLPLVFNAIAKTNDPWTIRIVGQGELDKTKEQAMAAGVSDRVEFCGFMEDPYEKAEDVMFCVMPSDYEGFCLVIPEALSRGIPVISTPVGCATEVIRPGENGYLVNLNDPDMLAQVLDYISAGALPVPDGMVCRESVRAYGSEQAFETWYNALLDVYRKSCRELHWKG